MLDRNLWTEVIDTNKATDEIKMSQLNSQAQTEVKNEKVSLSIIRDMATSYKKEAFTLEGLSNKLTKLYKRIQYNNVPLGQRVGTAIRKEQQLSLRFLVWFAKDEFWENIKQMQAVVFQPQLYYDDDFLHLCRNNCSHEDDFIEQLLNNFTLTPEVVALIEEWKVIGDRGVNCQNDTELDALFSRLATVLKRDNFKIREDFQEELR